MTVVKVVEDVAFGAHWPCQTMGRGLCAKIRAGGSPRASREPLVASRTSRASDPKKIVILRKVCARAAFGCALRAAARCVRLRAACARRTHPFPP